MKDEVFNAICFYMGGSWVYQALHDVPESFKQKLKLQFIDNVGEEELEETIAYVKGGCEGPMPKWLAQQCSKEEV